ncbi:MAG: aldo/keto reductase [Hyphomicrobiaceae bacterium]
MNIYYSGVNQRGFGTWPLRGDDAKNAVRAAVEVGYRAFDTAQMYENEAETGAALAESGLPRADLCITTKVKPDNYNQDRFIGSVDQSVRDLGGEPVDVLLLHWPTIGGDVVPSLELLQQAHDQGLARNIGISNFTIAQMRTALSVLDAPIVANQVEYHPLIDQSNLRAAAAGLGIPLTAYCSIARGKIFEYRELAEIGRDYHKSPAQVALRWILQRGIAINTMSTKPENIRANFCVMDFTLSSVHLARIDELSKRVNFRLVDDVPWAPEWDQ